jgi:hypothetical protein
MVTYLGTRNIAKVETRAGGLVDHMIYCCLRPQAPHLHPLRLPSSSCAAKILNAAADVMKARFNHIEPMAEAA